MKKTALPKFFFGGILPIILVIGLGIAPDEAHSRKSNAIIKRVQEKYEELKTLSAHFEYRYQTGTGEVKSEAGLLFLAEGDKFKTETPSQITICDGNTLWMYNSLEKQVIIKNTEDSEDGLITPEKLLYEFPARYEVKEVNKVIYAGLVCDKLVMVPKDPTDPARQLQVWIDRDESLTRKFYLEDLADNVTVFEFEDYKYNEKLPEDTFQFVPPQGVEVIDMR
ncbi:hypothetical protein CEE37_08690 [candidate division LCP-89 bacterium B3_LCP]|uniref:Outer-membrane lipoprotein carrier protein n=1 Tax=candidate division LCP-89 bacterium B3_LCP TaxID=2012998 RepID=A0A532UZS9_UNCL8|nr:MAG: hypothetical protein CEE37_08690 [candidate division LCP-89 bacterium B3_LCP]